MVVLSKIYTRTGDAGETALGNGVRVAKHSLRVDAYGTVDEINATVGLARLHAKDPMDARLSMIQNDLFDIGADLCRPDMEKDALAEYPPLRVTEDQVSRLETEIDEMNGRLDPLKSFILPGGSDLAAHLHLCRTVTRRAERLATELAAKETKDARAFEEDMKDLRKNAGLPKDDSAAAMPVNPAAVKYLNRLSDWFFVAARIANNDGKNDVLWVPGANR